jgi:chaperonin cofactor prefoldin
MTMVVAELQTKVEKYESRASRCEAQAREAKDKAQQTFYEVLAGYYASLAADFRKILEKRMVA